MSSSVSNSVFAELRFWLMVALSTGLPIGVYAVLLVKRAISPRNVLLLGLALIAVAGLDVYFLQSLAMLAKDTPSLSDDWVFTSQVSVALYLLPAMFGGVGVNVISHVLVRHLAEAERRFTREHPESRS